MLIQNYIYIVFALSLAGSLFALYMSLYSAIKKVCPFNEECPRFLGYPACYYGLIMFLVMLVASSMSLFGNLALATTKQVLTIVSMLGILFAGSYFVGNVEAWLVGGRKYGLILPSCAYGLIFYGLILAVSLFV